MLRNENSDFRVQDHNKGFSSFEISPKIIKVLGEASFLEPTEIQSAAIPLVLGGSDLIACAQTGTGKTAAFLLPVLTLLEKNPHDTALIMAPTREIVQQISAAARLFCKYLPGFKVATIIGGARMGAQLASLSQRPRLVVGTPGRLNDLYARRRLDLSRCRNLILDEADRMLDMGFAPQIEILIRALPRERQTLMFSATMAPPVEKLARTYLVNPKFVRVGPKESPVDNLKQKVVITAPALKEAALKDELTKRPGSILVFAQTQRRVEKLGRLLDSDGFKTETLHGGRTQGQRFRALRNFKEGGATILVATDVASRGLDISDIGHVINFDLPTNSEDFLHRIGRTARNGRSGESLTIVAQNEEGDFNRIRKYFKNCEIVGAFEAGSRSAARSTSSQRSRGGGGSWRSKSSRPGRFSRDRRNGRGNRSNSAFAGR